MIFLQIAAGQTRCQRLFTAAFDAETRRSLPWRNAASRHAVSVRAEPCLDGRRSASAFCARLIAGTAPRPSRSSGTRVKPRRRRCDGFNLPPACPKSSCSRRADSDFPRQCGQQFLLAVAGNAGDAENLATRYHQIDFLERSAERIMVDKRKCSTRRRTSPAARGARWHSRNSLPIIMRARLSFGFVGRESPCR